jgi:hypothetical protein
MNKKEFPTVPIKLIIQNTSDDKEEKKLFHFTTKSKEKYSHGLNLSGFPVRLCIGPWIFYWNQDYSLCIPKIQKGSRHAVVCLTVGMVELNDSVLKLLSGKIKQWNCETIESQTSFSFCLEILKLFNIDLDIQHFSGCFQDYLIKASNKDKVKMNYYVPDEILKKEKKRKMYFQSHEELDLFVISILKEHPTFKVDFKDDWELLKSIDEAFWLRHFKARCKIEDQDEVSISL